MKRTLLTGTALATAAMLASSPASAEIKVSAFMDFGMGFANTDQPGGGPSRDGHAFSTNSEVHFKGSGKTDAGLEYGFTMEFEGDSSDNAEDPDAAGGTGANIDETSIYIKGAFGKITMGQNDNAADKEIDGQVYGVTGQSNVSDTGIDGIMKTSSTKKENDLTDGSDANMIMYESPRFGGVQAKVSYTPQDGAYQAMWGGNINTSHKFEGVGIKLNATGALGEYSGDPIKEAKLSGYNIGLALDWEGFKFETGYMRQHDGNYAQSGDDDEVFVIGAGYGQGPWAVNVIYTDAEEKVSRDQWEVWSVGASYNVAKGLSVTAAALFAEDTDVSVGSAYDYQQYTLVVETSW
ncbi:MAG: porin [Proteobacteria bacterium]|nr:porin [Pseudomonadota bacterium]